MQRNRLTALLLVSIFTLMGCGGPKELSIHEYQDRIRELENERIAIISCIEWAGINASRYGTESLVGLHDTIRPIEAAENKIDNWLCLNGGRQYSRCATSVKPPKEVELLHHELCQHLAAMKDALSKCANDIMSASAYTQIPTYYRKYMASLYANIEIFNDEANTFEDILTVLESKIGLVSPEKSR